MTMAMSTYPTDETTTAKSIMRAAGLRVRDQREWRAEAARRQRATYRPSLTAEADATVARAALRPVAGRAAVAALDAALHRVQVRAQTRTLRLKDIAQAVHETLDRDDDGHGYIAAKHQVAGSYGYPVSYTVASAQWCSSGVLVIIDRRASSHRQQHVLLSHSCARVLRGRLVRETVTAALAQLPAGHRDVLVTREDSIRAGNCTRITMQAVSALGQSARAEDVVRWTAAQGIGVHYALRAVKVAVERVGQSEGR